MVALRGYRSSGASLLHIQLRQTYGLPGPVGKGLRSSGQGPGEPDQQPGSTHRGAKGGALQPWGWGDILLDTVERMPGMLSG